jgi:hypothetical protein
MDEQRSLNTRLLLGVITMAAIAFLGLWIWRATADTRALLATRATLRDTAPMIAALSHEPEPGPTPILDGWGRQIEYRVSGMGRELVSAGPDGRYLTSDDEIQVIDQTPLGKALADNANALSAGGSIDRQEIAQAAEATFGEPVSVEYDQTLLFLDATQRVLLEVSMSPFGEPRYVGGLWAPPASE